MLLIAAGTILGGVWADYSWGRFWGWDPKEVWALITLLVYLIPLHGRFAGWVSTFGLVAASVVCFLSVIMAWYGVNFVLGVGLHSYGFVEGGSQGIMLVILMRNDVTSAGRRLAQISWVSRSSEAQSRWSFIGVASARLGFDPKRKDSRNRRTRRTGILGGFSASSSGRRPRVQVQPELSRTPLLGRRSERARGAAAVSADAVLSPLANLDPGRGELDQRLEHVGRWASASFGVPELFPDLVCFPIISSVEKLDATQERDLPPPFLRAGLPFGSGDESIEVARRTSDSGAAKDHRGRTNKREEARAYQSLPFPSTDCRIWIMIARIRASAER